MHVEPSIKMKDRITQIITPITKQEAEPGNYPAGLTEKKMVASWEARRMHCYRKSGRLGLGKELRRG